MACLLGVFRHVASDEQQVGLDLEPEDGPLHAGDGGVGAVEGVGAGGDGAAESASSGSVFESDVERFAVGGHSDGIAPIGFVEAEFEVAGHIHIHVLGDILSVNRRLQNGRSLARSARDNHASGGDGDANNGCGRQCGNGDYVRLYGAVCEFVAISGVRLQPSNGVLACGGCHVLWIAA